MTEEKFRQSIQIIVAKLALGIRITVNEKKLLIRWRASEVVNRDRLKRAA